MELLNPRQHDENSQMLQLITGIERLQCEFDLKKRTVPNHLTNGTENRLSVASVPQVMQRRELKIVFIFSGSLSGQLQQNVFPPWLSCQISAIIGNQGLSRKSAASHQHVVILSCRLRITCLGMIEGWLQSRPSIFRLETITPACFLRYCSRQVCALTSHLSMVRSFLSSLLVLGLLQHLLHNLLLLNKECTNDAISDAVAASRTAVCSLHGLLRSAGGGVFSRSEGGNLFMHIIRNVFLHNPENPLCRVPFSCFGARLTPGSFTPQSPHFGAVPRFLMCRSLSLPPGVLIMRTLLEEVL
jgi:hypothetical protein